MGIWLFCFFFGGGKEGAEGVLSIFVFEHFIYEVILLSSSCVNSLVIKSKIQLKILPLPQLGCSYYCFLHKLSDITHERQNLGFAPSRLA